MYAACLAATRRPRNRENGGAMRDWVLAIAVMCFVLWVINRLDAIYHLLTVIEARMRPHDK